MTAHDFVESAKTLLGKKYVWGGESDAEGGYDCSGFLYASANKAGYKVSRWTSNGFSKIGESVKVGSQEPGDCLFFGSATNKITHCSIYLGHGKMIESRGNSSNTKTNPGTGVVISNLSRRSDLQVVRRWWSTPSTTVKSSYHFEIGKTYTLKVDHLHVRWSVGGNIKSRNELTLDGMKHAYADGCLKKGTIVTCKEVIEKDKNIWIKIPSGWICAVKGSEVYVA